MNTVTRNSYKLAHALQRPGEAPELNKALQAADVWNCTDDLQYLENRDALTCILTWAQRWGKQVACTCRVERFVPQRYDIQTRAPRKGLALEKYQSDDWPAWGRDVAVPPWQSAAKAVTENDPPSLMLASEGHIPPWYQHRPGPYNIMPYPEMPHVPRVSAYTMNPGDHRWREQWADFHVQTHTFIRGMEDEHGKPRNLTPPIVKIGPPLKISSMVWKSNQWSIIPLGDPTDPACEFGRVRGGDLETIHQRGQRSRTWQLSQKGPCSPIDGLDTLPFGGYFHLAEWHSVGVFPAIWQEGTGFHWSWSDIRWCDAVQAMWDIPATLRDRAIDRDVCVEMWLGSMMSEAPWRYAAKDEEQAGMSVDEVLGVCRAAVNTFGVSHITLPISKYDFDGHDKPARELVEYLQGPWRKRGGVLIEE